MDVKQSVNFLIEELNYEKIFVFDAVNKKEYSYANIFSMAYLWGKELLESINIVVMNNGIELLTLYFAAMFHKQIIIPIDPDKSDIEVESIKKHHPTAKIINRSEYNITNQVLSHDEIKALFENVDFQADYLITYTSGSIGEPKGVVHSVGNLFYSALSFGRTLNYNSNTRMSHVMPMTYMAGILNTIFLPFVMGGSVVLMERFSVKNVMRFWKSIMTYSVNTLWISPTILHLIMLIDRGEEVKKYMRDVQMTISVGTAPLALSLKRKFEEKYDIRVYQSYGLSETLFLTTADDICNYEDSVGGLLTEVELTFGEDDEILIDVPWMFKRYVNADQETYFDDKKYKTGDVGQIKDNQLYILGRKKDLIIKGGINIYPKDIEKCLSVNFELQEICVASKVVNDEELIICWYVGETLDEKRMNNVIIEKLGKNYKIDCFVRMKQIYKNLNGKIDKRKLIEEFKG